MKYVIDKNNDKMRLMYYNVNMIGLKVNPINEVPDLRIKAREVLLIDDELRKNYIKKRINRKINKIIRFMLRILNDEETTEDDTGMVLDEVNRLKGIIINKYRQYMLDSEYKEMLTKLILIEEEFRKSYNEKQLLNNNYYVEEVREERSR